MGLALPGSARAVLRSLAELLLQGARAAGFPNERWTVQRMAAVMHVHFGGRYHAAHVWQLVRRMGGSGQMPERRAIERDAQAIAHWKRDQWPAIKKCPSAGRPSGLPG